MNEQETIRWQNAFKKTYNGMSKESDEACDMAIAALEEIQQYRVIGTVEKCRENKAIVEELSAIEMAEIYVMLEELKKYQSIGTPEECRSAVGKQKAKKTIYDKPLKVLECPSCGNYLQKVLDDDATDGCIPHYCKKCGQKISADWREEE